MSIVLRSRHFTGSKKVFTAEPDGLANIIRALAVDNARIRLKAVAPASLTDNSTGTAAGGGALADLVLPAAPFNATAGNGAQAAALNTALTAINNAHAVIGTSLNLSLAPLGLPAISGLNTGTVAAANTIPALIKAGTTASGAASADYNSGRAALSVAKANHQKLLRSMFSVLAALGETGGSNLVSGSYGYEAMLLAPGAVAAAADGSSAVALADAAAFLLALANNTATLAAAWNAVLASVAAGTRPLAVVAG